MDHRILRNATDKPMKHPLTGQVIMPGQLYTEPEKEPSSGLQEPTEQPDIHVQSIADPESTKKAIATNRRNKTGDK